MEWLSGEVGILVALVLSVGSSVGVLLVAGRRSVPDAVAQQIVSALDASNRATEASNRISESIRDAMAEMTRCFERHHVSSEERLRAIEAQIISLAQVERSIEERQRHRLGLEPLERVDR